MDGIMDRNELFLAIWGEFTKLIRQGLLKDCERLRVLYSERRRKLGIIFAAMDHTLQVFL